MKKAATMQENLLEKYAHALLELAQINAQIAKERKQPRATAYFSQLLDYQHTIKQRVLTLQGSLDAQGVRKDKAFKKRLAEAKESVQLALAIENRNKKATKPLKSSAKPAKKEPPITTPAVSAKWAKQAAQRTATRQKWLTHAQQAAKAS